MTTTTTKPQAGKRLEVSNGVPGGGTQAGGDSPSITADRPTCQDVAILQRRTVVEPLYVPAYLEARPQWVCWRYEVNDDGDLTKPPTNARTGGNAASTIPATWATLDAALDFYHAKNASVSGIGYVLAADDDLTGIDLDHCFQDGQIVPWAASIVAKVDSYTEISPSGEGLRIFCRGQLPAGGRKRGDIEMYDRGRYLTFTGNHLPGTPLEVYERQEAIDALHADTFADRQTAATRTAAAQPVSLADADLLAKARCAKDGRLFAALFDGDASGYPSASEADLALCNLLAFWTGNDAARIDRLFRQSGLYREKWDIRHASDGRTYGQMTIVRATDRADVYTPHGNGTDPQPAAVASNGHAAAVLRYEPQIETIPEEITVDIQDLPAAARLPETLGGDAGAWLTEYIRFASEVSERTPWEVHQAAGLYVVSVSIARRLYLPMRHADIFPNLYILAVAPTTLYAKTTGLGVMTGLLDDGIPHLQLSNESTPEALLAELAGREPSNLDSKDISDQERETWKQGQKFAAQRGLVLEEASTLLAGLKRDYMQGMAELILRLYDCPRLYRRHTRGGGYAMIRHAYLSMCGWTTPERLRTAEIATGWKDGLFARCALVTPSAPPRRPADDGYAKAKPDRPGQLLEDLTRLANGLLPQPDDYPKPVTSRPVAIEDDALQAWWRYYQATSHDLLTSRQAPDARLHGTYGRLSTGALKVSLLLAAMDWTRGGGAGDPVVTLAHYAAAQRIAEGWRESAHRLLNTLSAKAEAEDEDRDLQRVLQVFDRKDGQWLAIRDVVRSLPSKQYTTATVSGILRLLEEDGRLEAGEHKPEGRGRPKKVFRIVSND